MSQREVAIVGSNNTKAKVTGQEELLVKVNSIDANIINNLNGLVRQAFTRRVAGSTDIISDIVYSISFASVGTGNALISSDEGASTLILKPGETISFNAGDINNYFKADLFKVDTTALNAEVLIIYTY
jgi:hypothetical protein